MEFIIGGKLEIGDVVIVPWTSRSINVGIYAGEGKNTQQWFRPNSVAEWKERKFNLKRPHVTFIRDYNNWSFAKLSIDEITNQEVKEGVIQALEILKERKLI